MTKNSNIAYRSATLEVEEGQYRVVFSSETPVWRTMIINGEKRQGYEILSHNPEHVDMSFFSSGRAPLLKDHLPEQLLGVVDSARLNGSQIEGSVRFSSAPPAAQIRADIDDRIRPNTSIGYEIRKIVWDGDKTFRVVDWRPYEASSVSVPFDPSAGFRGGDLTPTEVIMETPQDLTSDIQPGDAPAPGVTLAARGASPEDLQSMREKHLETEKKRIHEIIALGRRFNQQELAADSIQKGTTIEVFRGLLLEKVGDSKPLASSSVDLTKKEKRKYSILKVLNVIAAGNGVGAQRARDEAGFELEIAGELSKEAQRANKGILIPRSVLSTRILNVGSAPAGGNLVGTDHLGQEYVDALFNKSILQQMGGRRLQGLQGNVEIPKMSSGVTHSWLAAENSGATVSEPVFDTFTLSPKDLTNRVQITRRLMQQSDPSVEMLAREELSRGLIRGLDQAGFTGTGANGEPIGILNLAGVQSANLATLSWANIVKMVGSGMRANILDLPGIAWAINATGYERLSTTTKDSGSGQFILTEASRPGVSAMRGRINGFDTFSSENVPSNLGPATDLSATIFGAFGTIVMGTWGDVDLFVDPYSNSNSGQLNLTVFQTVDIAYQYPQAFVVAQDLAAA